MRLLPFASLTIAALCCATSVHAAEQASWQERFAARNDLVQSKINLRNYWQVEYPRMRRDLDAAIELTEMELQNNKDLLHEYKPFTQFSIGQPFPITIRNLQMCIREGELRLNNLRADRNALIRFKGDQFRQLEMDVFAARMRVAELEANDTTETPPASRSANNGR